MRKMAIFAAVLLLALSTAGCAGKSEGAAAEKTKTIGIMLTDNGLGDQSFNDSGFQGLMKARDELGITFDYREIKDTGTYEKGLTQLVREGNDLVVGLGYSMQADLEKVAKKYPKQRFVLIDSVSDLDNVTSVTFKEDEGSFLAGALAAMTSKTGTIGFIGGSDADVIKRFKKGYLKGAESVKPNIPVLSEISGTFDDDKLGKRIAQNMIRKKADVLFTAAGFTGVGALKEAEARKVYAIGVDSDQYYTAEHAVISSLVKNVDHVIYELAKDLKDNKEIKSGEIVYGLKENGMDLAKIRVVKNAGGLTKKITDMKNSLIEKGGDLK
ncbi:Basic membrane protein A2 Immunodominant antigen P39 [Bacillus velezensis M27]|uniref:BMP family lipoprotein n=1 Tax=Bacillus TaxID=1386 RepID=UPI0002867228|nr:MULTISPECIES: BMP family ABC transporter substrate-binding protein [Bacillus amyloliquefaciens group]ASF54621.1 BMP family ABC transporter substrate-binding protein [Bacillus velezensis]EKE47443.1 Basic membrane protein A2 Immunodominant antigen P39 [Bacillus velezensis M27]NMV99277.1 BMP family ABC transporter substrate-binding protein [Bacillus velezensis]TNU62541.1 BMP family ABC transporter substrate-binding protein [Bacillus velezensis]USP43167.1 BMP family ABC transporter substrate-bi